MPNQMFEWVEPRQRFCTQCHYDNFLGTPMHSNLQFAGEVWSCCHHCIVTNFQKKFGVRHAYKHLHFNIHNYKANEFRVSI